MSEEKNDLIESTTGSATVDDNSKPIQHQKRVAVVKGPDNFGMYFIGFSAGGEMPAQFKNNRYTSHAEAERAVEDFNKSK